MKRLQILITAIILGIGVGVCMAGPRDALRDQVDDAIDHGLPKTAIDILDQIIPGALADEAYAEATKAICLKIAQEGRIEGGKAEEMIVRLQDELAEAPEGGPGPAVAPRCEKAEHDVAAARDDDQNVSSARPANRPRDSLTSCAISTSRRPAAANGYSVFVL